MIKTTREQRKALYNVWLRSRGAPFQPPANPFAHYKAFRQTVRSGPDCIMVPFAGMWLGIEKNGYIHS